ncbi:ATP-grasp domain-containing protein [Streptomyces sp. NPDC018833]|uniref:ATP-grasp domain-containing protein n=1 Tax=Streptomyces sp. NPDC018833 TaxID=3365053 RepID=UPI00378E07C5
MLAVFLPIHELPRTIWANGHRCTLTGSVAACNDPSSHLLCQPDWPPRWLDRSPARCPSLHYAHSGGNRAKTARLPPSRAQCGRSITGQGPAIGAANRAASPSPEQKKMKGRRALRIPIRSGPGALGARADEANEALTVALDGRPVINLDRYTSARRVAYTGPAQVTAARPHVALGYYQPWSAAEAGHTIVPESTQGIRQSGERKHRWWQEIAERSMQVARSFSRPPVAIGWWETRELRSLAGPEGRVLGLQARVRHVLEEKTALDDILRGAGVSPKLFIRSAIYSDRLPSLNKMRQAVGTQRIVIQAGHNGGGRGTVFVDDERGMEPAAAMSGPWKVSAFVEGWSSNTTVLSLPDGKGGVQVYVDRPSHTAMAVSELGIGPAKGAGHQWATPFPATDVENLVEAAVRIGTWAWQHYGLVGLWGIDTIWTPDGPVINEINARMQGTTEVSGVNQLLAGYPPLVVAHLTTMLDHPVRWLPEAGAFNTQTVASAQGNTPAPYYVKVRARRRVQTPAGFRGSGLYRFDGTRLTWHGPGANPIQADSDNGLVLLANVPAGGVTCEANAELGTFEGLTAGPAAPFGGPEELSSHGRALLGAFDRLFLPCNEGAK